MENTNFPNEKTAKNIGVMFKNIKGAGRASPQLAMVFQAMELLAPIMDAFQPVLDMVSGLFEIMSAQIIPVLVEALEPVMDALKGLMPLFEQLGVAIAPLIVALLQPLIDIFLMFMPILEMVIGFLIQLMPIITIITEISNKLLMATLAPLIDVLLMVFDALAPVFDLLEDLTPIFEDLEPVISLVASVIGTLIRWSLLPLVMAIYAIGYVIATLMDVFTLYVHGYTKQWQDIMLPIMESLATGGSTSTSGTVTTERATTGGGRAIQEMQGGGGISTEGEYYLHNEWVIPIEKWEKGNAQIVFQLETLIDLNTRILADKEWRHR